MIAVQSMIPDNFTCGGTPTPALPRKRERGKSDLHRHLLPSYLSRLRGRSSRSKSAAGGGNLSARPGQE